MIRASKGSMTVLTREGFYTGMFSKAIEREDKLTID